MKTVIYFVGVRANHLLEQSVSELIEERLTENAPEVEKISFRIGSDLDAMESGSASGEAQIELLNDDRIVVQSPSSKLMPLVENCIKQLAWHFERTIETAPKPNVRQRASEPVLL